jgi:integrase
MASAFFRLQCSGGVEPRRFVFTGRDGAPLRKCWNARHFQPAAARVGLLEGPPKLRPHHLRHTAVSLLIANGASAKDIQEWVGRSGYQVTMDVYGHLFPERLPALAVLIDQVHRS